MHLILLLALTAASYGGYNVLIKISSRTLHPIAGAVYLQIGAALLAGAAFFYFRGAGERIELARPGWGWAVLAGSFVALAELLSFYVFARGVPGTVGIPAIIGGSVVAGALFSAVFLKEKLGPADFIAIGLIVAGVLILGVRQRAA